MHGDQIQSFSWHGNGSMLVTSCKDKTLRLIDPRAKAVTQETKGHASIRDSRALWLGETPFIVSTGFDSVCIKTREKKYFSSVSIVYTGCPHRYYKVLKCLIFVFTFI